jgi:hypothetical protein
VACVSSMTYGAAGRTGAVAPLSINVFAGGGKLAVEYGIDEHRIDKHGV